MSYLRGPCCARARAVETPDERVCVARRAVATAAAYPSDSINTRERGRLLLSLLTSESLTYSPSSLLSDVVAVGAGVASEEVPVLVVIALVVAIVDSVVKIAFDVLFVASPGSLAVAPALAAITTTTLTSSRAHTALNNA